MQGEPLAWGWKTWNRKTLRSPETQNQKFQDVCLIISFIVATQNSTVFFSPPLSTDHRVSSFTPFYFRSKISSCVSRGPHTLPTLSWTLRQLLGLGITDNICIRGHWSWERLGDLTYEWECSKLPVLCVLSFPLRIWESDTLGTPKIKVACPPGHHIEIKGS